MHFLKKIPGAFYPVRLYNILDHDIRVSGRVLPVLFFGEWSIDYFFKGISDLLDAADSAVLPVVFEDTGDDILVEAAEQLLNAELLILVESTRTPSKSKKRAWG